MTDLTYHYTGFDGYNHHGMITGGEIDQIWVEKTKADLIQNIKEYINDYCGGEAAVSFK